MASNVPLRDVRPSPVAGTWYPGDRVRLESMVDALLAQAGSPALPGPVVGLIAPHAGLQYSGQVAAHAYATLRGRAFNTVVLLGPDHRGVGGAYTVPAFRRFQTPLGNVAIDAAALEDLGRDLEFQYVADDEEHALEMQLPFLQRLLGNFSLAPILLGYPLIPRYGQTAWQSCQALGGALERFLAARKDILVVASSDLSHLYDYDDVARYDRVFNSLVETLDVQRLAEALMAGECHACGGAAIVAALMALKAAGASQATVLAYANSGDVTGSRGRGQYTVGYAAVAITGVE